MRRWAVHELQFGENKHSSPLVKTIKFPEELSSKDLSGVQQNAEKLLCHFVRLKLEMDVDLRVGDTLFTNELRFAMQLRDDELEDAKFTQAPSSRSSKEGKDVSLRSSKEGSCSRISKGVGTLPSRTRSTLF